MSINIPFSEACERNKEIILQTIKPYLSEVISVLEVGSGTAQHAIHFARALSHLKWQTSDQLAYLEGINAALSNAEKTHTELDNLIRPFELNVNQAVWDKTNTQYQAVYTANTFHIMSESDVQQFFTGLGTVTQFDSYLIVYGPFKYANKFTSESNDQFDQTLRSRGVGSGIRDFEWVNSLATDQGFELLNDHSMPANNQCLVWQCKV